MGAFSKSSPTVPYRAPQLRLLTMKEVAQRLGISLQRTYEMGRLGLLPVVRLGRQLRIEEGRLAVLAQRENEEGLLPQGRRSALRAGIYEALGSIDPMGDETSSQGRFRVNNGMSHWRNTRKQTG